MVQIVLGEFSFERVVLVRVVFGASCPVFWLTPYAVKETRPFSCIAVAAIFTCKSFVLLNLTYFAHFISIIMNTFVWLLFSVPENKYGYARAGTSDYVAFLTDIEMNEGPAIKQQPSK